MWAFSVEGLESVVLGELAASGTPTVAEEHRLHPRPPVKGPVSSGVIYPRSHAPLFLDGGGN